MIIDKDIWGEDHRYPRSDWRAEVAAEDTQLGYWEWVEHKIEEDPDVAAKRLADAAPDLLSALRALLTATIDDDIKFNIKLTELEEEAQAQALAAIAKATGRKS